MSVCYLDVQDEITDAVARLRAASDGRVIVVLPPGSRIGTSRINFRLLLREAELARHCPGPGQRRAGGPRPGAVRRDALVRERGRRPNARICRIRPTGRSRGHPHWRRR